MVAQGLLAYQLELGNAKLAAQRARDLAYPFGAKEIPVDGDLIRLEVNGIVFRAYEVPRAVETPIQDDVGYRSLLSPIEREVGRIAVLRDKTGLGSVYLTPVPRTRAPVIEVGRYAVFDGRNSMPLDRDIGRIESVSDSGKTVTVSGSTTRQRANRGDIVQTFSYEDDAKAAIAHSQATALVLDYVKCARESALVELMDDTE
ncbi:hypothetical protein [Paraburkholderia sp. J8-2]|uniref:hypothetical protein n=1 Tax=Paraburkholderia sp. J8-2 TaxID=2805440 RepID=UPI002AB6BD14|nr:hypothetical protein [Paraburkholderia sp. J8-2]